MDEDDSIFYGTIKDSVREKVSDVLWLDHLKAQDELVKQRIKSQIKTDERCMVCTLPYGSCEHTRQWLDTTLENNEMEGWKSSLDKEIDDMMSVFNDGFQVDTAPADEDLDLDGMQWNRLEQRLTDKIGASEFSLFAPDERGWHSTVKLTDKLICVFGGFRYKKNMIPQPFKAVPNPLDIEYLNDIRIYDVDNLCWYGVKANGRKGHNREQQQEQEGEEEEAETDHPIHPEGRYGHVAVALDGSRMLIYGGRGFHGKIFNDTWIYHQQEDRWEWIHTNEAINMPIPLARYFSSAATAPKTNNVYLFGGTNGVENFGDLWLFRGDERVLRWERLVAVGMPPCPRYGHQCVVIGEEQLAILGGCHVSPSGELVGSNLSTSETKSLIELSSILTKRYKAEGAMARHGGQALESSIEHTSSVVDEHGLGLGGSSSLVGNSALTASQSHLQHTNHLTDVYQQAAHISGSLHLLEQDTRIAELNMMNTYKLSHAAKNFNIHQAKHSVNHLDIVFLSLKETMWKTQLFPPIKGKIPVSRIHFGAACIAKYLFVFGGIEPTSKAYKQVDERYTKINILNLESMKWDCKIPTNSADYLIEPLKIADADIIRAKQRIQEERARGRMLGALNGKTVELAEAEAILKVCEWRKGVLLKEEADCLDPPHPRFGCTLTSIHQRLVYCGGWYPDRAVPQGDVMVLNLEQEHERLRRLSDEFTARLARDRVAEEAAATMANVQSIYELRAMREEEQRNMLREQKEMLLEEFLSGLAPLSKPLPVKCVKVNQHTMWVKWDRVHKNSKHQTVDPESVTYMLYAQIGLESLLVNDRVNVLAPFPVESPKKGKKKHLPKKPIVLEVPNSGKADFDVEKFWFFNEKRRRKEGEITQVHDNGTYDVLYDDGNSEKNVPRSRIRLIPPPPAPSIDVSAASSRASSRPGTSESRLSRGSGGGGGAVGNSRPGTADSANNPGLTVDAASLGSAVSKPSTANSRRSNYDDLSNSRVIVPAVVKRRQQSKSQKKRRAQKQLEKFRKPLVHNKILYGDNGNPGNSKPSSRNGSRPTSRPTSRQEQGTSRGGNHKFKRSDSGLSSVSRSPQMSARGGAGYDFLSEMDSLLDSRPGSPGASKLVPSLLAVASPLKSAKKGRKVETLAEEEDESVVAAPAPRPTVKVDCTKWKLVYMGNECEYVCGNIVPSEILEREPGIVVSVAFCLQTLGIDDPIYETSQLSDPAYFTTSKPPAIKTLVKNSSAVVATSGKSASVAPAVVEEESCAPVTTMSKTKKEIITAVINGQQMINMERRHNSYHSEGQSDHYL